MTPDVNVLVAASRADHPRHAPALAWLRAAIADAAAVRAWRYCRWRACLCLDTGWVGNFILDAWIAAAVRTLDSHLVTFDRGFGKLLARRELTLLPIAP